MSLILTIIVLGVLIVIHEFGHFLACRLTRVRVEKFSVGFGPEIFAWQGRETRYAISLFPLGGFVKPAGESWSELDENQGPKKGDYLAAPLASRILIVIAGVVMNYLLAFCLFTAVFMTGRPVPSTVVGGLSEGYPAASSGLQVGDRVIVVNGQKVNKFQEMLKVFNSISEGPFELTVERGSMPLHFNVMPREEELPNIFGKPEKKRVVGITSNPEAVEFEKYPFAEAFRQAFDAEVELAWMTHKAIFYLIMGKMSFKMMMGPVGIIKETGAAASRGWPYLLQLTAILSVSLAVINLFPIPALDGGHLLFLLVEGIRRKPVSLAAQERATQVGFILLLGLMAFIIYNDFVNLGVFEKILNWFQNFSH